MSYAKKCIPLSPPWHTSFWSFINNILKNGTYSTIQVVTLYILFLKWVWSWKSENICRFKTQKLQSVPFFWKGHFFYTNTSRKTVAIFLFIEIGYSPVFFELPSGIAIYHWSFLRVRLVVLILTPSYRFIWAMSGGGQPKNESIETSV